LRKIVQVSHHLPLARPRDVLGVLTEGLDALLEEYKHGPFDSRVWQNLFGFFMRPLFTSLRDVRRYLNVLPLTLQSVGDEVAAVDVLGLEALRVMLPDVFEQVPRLRGRLAGLGYDSFARHGNDSERARGAAELAPLLDQSAPYQSEMTQFLNLLFPGTRSYLENTSYASDFLATWRRDRRVAHPDVLDFYLERILPTGTLPAELV
jgi:hypothetical protein